MNFLESLFADHFAFREVFAGGRGGFSGFPAADQEENAVESGYVDQKQHQYTQRVQNGTAAQQVVQDVVGGSVSLHEEHIVGAKGYVGQVSGDAEAAQNGEGDPDIPLLHAGHARQPDVEGGKAGDAVGDSRGYPR